MRSIPLNYYSFYEVMLKYGNIKKNILIIANELR